MLSTPLPTLPPLLPALPPARIQWFLPWVKGLLMLEYAEGLPEPLAISVQTTCATDGPVAPDNLLSQERASLGLSTMISYL